MADTFAAAAPPIVAETSVASHVMSSAAGIRMRMSLAAVIVAAVPSVRVIALIAVGAAPTTLTITQTPEGSGELAARLVAAGGPVSGQTITFTLAPPTASGSPSFLCSGITGADGIARCTITGLQRITLSLPGSRLRNRFVATYSGAVNYAPATVAVGGPPPPQPRTK